MATKEKFISVFKSCLDILRDNESITGKEALKNISYLLVLKLIEPKLEELNIDNYKYNFNHIDPDQIKEYKIKLLEIIRFSNLSKENKFCDLIRYLWEDILSVHPITKNIYPKDSYFDIEKNTTFKKLINKLSEFDFENKYDLLGEAYENLIKDIMTGKILGQFFTNPIIKNLMIKLIDPKIKPNGEIESCADPAAGTGGFLTSYMKYIINKAESENITLNLKSIRNGIYGKEIEPDTYQLAYSNMIINNYDFNLEKGDSIRNPPIIKKFDNILANPPFGIEGLNYKEINYPNKREYLPIKSNNAVSLFIQAIIYMLKINGKCAVIVPDGKDLYGETNIFINIRKYLINSCQLKQVIYLPSGLFNNTGIRTCILFFVKKRNLEEVINLKTNKFKEVNNSYNVKFYEYNETKTLLVKVPIEDIQDKNYSLNYKRYIEENIQKYKEEVKLLKLKDISTFLPKSKRLASYGKDQGEYPFFRSSNIVDKYTDKPDYKEKCLIIGDGGIANIKFSSKFSCSSHNHIIKINNGRLIRYIYYYIFYNMDLLEDGFLGSGIKNISKKYLQEIKIPIPHIETQKEIIIICKEKEERITKLRKELKEKIKLKNLELKNLRI